MLKILQATLQQYVNCELPDVQDGFRKGRGTRDQIPNIRGIIEKAREFQETSAFALLTMPKPLTLDHNKLWKILKRMGIPDHLNCLLRNLFAGQEARVRTGNGTTDQFHFQTDLFKLGKEYVKAVYCHPAYLTFMQSTS